MLRRILGAVFAVVIMVAVVLGVCSALGLSAGTSFLVLIILAVLTILGGLSKRQEKPLGRSAPVHTRHIPQSVKVQVAARDGARCVRCGSTENIQFDHLIPFSRGGSSTDPNNIQLLCGRCNRLKSNRYIG